MLPYLTFFFPFAFLALNSHRRTNSPSLFICIALILIVFIGLRFQVGGDWYTYLGHIHSASLYTGHPLWLFVTTPEPLYAIATVLSYRLFESIYPLNILCASIFTLGLLSFCRAQREPFIALVSALPYLVLVVALGYTRQSVSIGFEMLAILFLFRRKYLRFFFSIFLATIFHKTSIILAVIFLAALKPRNNVQLFLVTLSLCGLIALSAPFFFALTDDYSSYLVEQFSSSGTLYRLLLCLIPSLIFLLKRKSISTDPVLLKTWTGFSIATLVLCALLILGLPSTIVDRMALYLIPIQLFVASELPGLRIFGLSYSLVKLLLVLYSAIFFFGWLLFATHSSAWLPYRNILLP